MSSEPVSGGERTYSEAEFSKIFYDYLLKNRGKKDLPKFTESFLEIAGPVGVADIITLDMQSSTIKLRRLSKNLGDVSRAAAAYLLSRLTTTRKTPVALLVEKSPLNRKTTTGTLNALVAANIIEMKDSLVRITKTFEIPNGTICFFEIKMKNWQRATFQAAQALAYSDYAFCVMPMRMLRILEDNKPRLRGLGVGMIVFDPETMVAKTVVKASRRGPKRKSAKIEMLLRISEKMFPKTTNPRRAKLTFFQRLIRFLARLLQIFK